MKDNITPQIGRDSVREILGTKKFSLVEDGLPTTLGTKAVVAKLKKGKAEVTLTARKTRIGVQYRLDGPTAAAREILATKRAKVLEIFAGTIQPTAAQASAVGHGGEDQGVHEPQGMPVGISVPTHTGGEDI